jgi:hypothetical protein
VRVVLKSLLFLVLSLLLLVGLGGLTFPWWGPAAFKQGTAKVLRQIGCSEAELSLDQVDLSQLSLTMERLRYQGATVADAGLKFGYTFKGLRDGELEHLALAHPGVELDLSYDWPAAKGTAVESHSSIWEQLPARFPIKNINIADAVLTILGTDWSRTVELSAELTRQERLNGQLTLQGEGIQLNAQAVDVLWPELSGRATATGKVDELAEWVEFGRDRGWLNLPTGLDLTVAPLEIMAGVGFAEKTLLDWNVKLLNQGFAASMATSRISAEQLELEARGAATQVAHLDLKVNNGRGDHRGLGLSFDQLLTFANSAEAIGFQLLGWELSGKSPLYNLGSVSVSAGDLELSVEGAWQAGLASFKTDNLGLRIRMAQAPLSLFTGLGSAAGTWQMNAEISADEARAFSLSAELLDGSLTAPAVSLESKLLSVSAQGHWPASLGAVVGVEEGYVTWSEGGGRLTGLKGEFELASLQPLASKGQQTLQFASIEQGELTTGPGQLHFNYAGGHGKAPTLKLEIATTALGGKVRILVDGHLSKTLSLSVRVRLDSVQLSEIAALFPQFDGRIEGLASGELALRLAGGQIILQPGGLQLVAGTSGRFEYRRQGWLTQDPRLNPEIFVSERDILEIMKNRQGAPVLTELAMRDLNMSEFMFKIEVAQGGEQSLVAQIRGDRSIKGVTVPVVLNVPIRGDVKETMNAVFKFNAQM